MEENLVGYLLNSLDPDAERRVAHLLDTQPEARHRLAVLRQALLPLAEDRQEEGPPRDLWVKTLGRLAEHMCRKLPDAPTVSINQRGGSRRSWRRIDVLVAASILLVMGLLVPSALLKIRAHSQRTVCADNLRKLGDGLLVYRETHKGFPNPAVEKEPYNVAGFALPLMLDAGAMENADLTCPGADSPVAFVRTASELRSMPVEEFRRSAPHLLGSYAYSLGYRANGEIAGFGSDHEDMPILADRPPSDPAGAGRELNSPNHGNGQNVLFPDGRVQFISTRMVLDDDVYLNWNGKQEVGVGARDAVLAPAATPLK